MTGDQVENIKSLILSRWHDCELCYFDTIDWDSLKSEDFGTAISITMATMAEERLFPLLPPELLTACESSRRMAPGTADEAWDRILKSVTGSQSAIDGLVNSRKACRACILLLVETIALSDPDSMLFTAPRFAAIWKGIQNG